MFDLCVDLEKQKPVLGEVAPLSLLKNDVFLCASNMISLTFNFLINPGFNGLLPLVFRDISTIVTMSGESFLSVRNLNESSSVLSRVSFAVVRVFVFSKMQSIPLMRPVALAMNAYGTFCVVQRAFEQFQNCREVSKDSEGEHNWQIARNIFVHGVNASCSLYNTATTCHQYMGDFFRADYLVPVSKEMPIIKPSQIFEEFTSHKEGGEKITMVSAYDNGIKQYADLVAPNQKAFAEKNGYGLPDIMEI